MMRSSLDNCPIPSEQQPLNEYEELRNAWLFRDTTLKVSDYIKKIVGIWCCSWVVAGPIAAASFSPEKQLIQFIICASAAATVPLGLILVRLYLGWHYICDRLYNEKVFYEESGWYDGQMWTKPPEVLTRDRLIVSYEIKPILKRLQFTFAVLILMYLIGTITWYIV